MLLAQRQTTGEDWVVVGRGDQEEAEAADDEQQQKVRLGMLEVTADDQRPVRWEGVGGGGLKRQMMTRGGSGGRGGGGLSWWQQLMTRGWSGGGGGGGGLELEATADDQRPVHWEGVWWWGLEATADDQRPVRWEGVWWWGLEATADDQRQRCVLSGEVRQWELESARRESEGEGAQRQQSTACQNSETPRRRHS